MDRYRKQQEQQLAGKQKEIQQLHDEKRKINTEYQTKVTEMKATLQTKLDHEKRQLQTQLYS